MVVAEFKALDAQDPQWQREAARLAKMGIPFVVVGFTNSLDAAFFQALKDRFNLDTNLDSESGRAYFKPKGQE